MVLDVARCRIAPTALWRCLQFGADFPKFGEEQSTLCRRVTLESAGKDNADGFSHAERRAERTRARRTAWWNANKNAGRKCRSETGSSPAGPGRLFPIGGGASERQTQSHNGGTFFRCDAWGPIGPPRPDMSYPYFPVFGGISEAKRHGEALRG